MTQNALADRIAARRRLMAALADCDVHDAEEVVYAWLDTVRPGTPFPAFASIEAEAENWAACATAPEIWYYFVACGHRLRHDDLGQRGMAQLAKRAADELPPHARRHLASDLLASCRPGAAA